ncbi:MAG: YgjV family protein [Hyphomicrobiales bacterium]|nr:YgjV family protein [Hyphomicrobiales bacterium]
MDSSLAAQLVGATGFLLLVLATFARSRFRFLVLDFLGLVPVAAHYVMLAAPAGAALSVFYMCADAVAALPGGSRRRLIYWVFYPLVAVITWFFWIGVVDLAAAAGTALAIVARHQVRTWRILALIGASTVGWGLYGVLVGSIAQVVFSAVYGSVAVFNAIRFSRQSKSASAA